jgi:hypothetical protein
MSAYPGRHKFVNIGAWIGERMHAIETLQKSIELYRHKPIDPTFDLDGPGAWFNYGLVQGTLDFALDRDCVLFQSMNGWSYSDTELREGRVYNTFTKTCPPVVHFNGCRDDLSQYYNLARSVYGI